MAEDAIRIMCPNLLCRKVLAVPSSARGKTVRCKACSTAIRIPEKPVSAKSGATKPAGPKPDAAKPAAAKPDAAKPDAAEAKSGKSG